VLPQLEVRKEVIVWKALDGEELKCWPAIPVNADLQNGGREMNDVIFLVLEVEGDHFRRRGEEADLPSTAIEMTKMRVDLAFIVIQRYPFYLAQEVVPKVSFAIMRKIVRLFQMFSSQNRRNKLSGVHLRKFLSARRGGLVFSFDVP